MTGRSGAVLALGLVALGVSWAFGSLPLLPLGLGLTLAAVLAWGWALLARRTGSLERRLPSSPPVEGGDLVVDYRLTGAAKMTLTGTRIQERLGRLGDRETTVGRRGGRLVVHGVPRGVYELGADSVVLQDPLGLERVVLPAPPAERLTVRPHTVVLRSPFSESGRRSGRAQRVLLRQPTGFDLHSVRPYAEGESLRKVHWPTTARRGELMVKELEDALDDEHAVLLVCDPAGDIGSPGSSSFDVAVRVAGSIALTHALAGRGVTLVVGGSTQAIVRVATVDGDWPVALDALAGAAADGPPLARLLADARGPAARAGDLTVVTTVLDPRAADRLVAERLTGRRVAVALVDPAGFGDAPARVSDAVRLAAAGLPVAVVRAGDDLRVVLEGETPGRVSA